ncbi:MAG: glycoside hydrolase family 5 protein [Lachnospiraceae bacterium]|nr:glycoside hydrolase family 5 protein [Lachnospiraceae bacterium]
MKRVIAINMILAICLCSVYVMPVDKADNNSVKLASASAKNAVRAHGRLRIRGTRIVDKNGKTFRFRGVSTHGVAWFPQYVNKRAFKTLRDKYNVNCIRLAMYTTKQDGYSKAARQTVIKGVKYAKQLGMYAIIDWHILNDGNPNTNKKKAIKFFRAMSKKFKSYNNVMYEICNEPNGNVSWKSDIKPYAKKITKVIRKNDKRGIIIVGSSTWSQDVDVTAQSPLKGKNIAYSLHFYAATHKDWNRQKLTTAVKKGLPVIVTEFSICDASGNGSLDKKSANTWMRLLKKYHISYCAWSLCNKAESSALIKSSCTKTYGFNKSDLSAAGKWYLCKKH